MELGLLAKSRGVRLLSLPCVDSTNDEARRLVAGGERGPLWIVAAQQSGGRGRRGRAWISPPGNLYATLIVSDFGDAARAPQLGFVAGVAAMRALRGLCGARDFALKWPNDVLLEGAKLAGVLLECVSVATGDARAPTAPVAMIGIGVNCASAPRDLPDPARALAEIGAELTAERVFAALADAFVAALDLWAGGAGFARLREAWLSDAAGLGTDVRVALANESVSGRFESIDATGRLVLATNLGLRVIEAGDVELGPRPVVGACA